MVSFWIGEHVSFFCCFLNDVSIDLLCVQKLFRMIWYVILTLCIENVDVENFPRKFYDFIFVSNDMNKLVQIKQKNTVFTFFLILDFGKMKFY